MLLVLVSLITDNIKGKGDSVGRLFENSVGVDCGMVDFECLLNVFKFYC